MRDKKDKYINWEHVFRDDTVIVIPVTRWKFDSTFVSVPLTTSPGDALRGTWLLALPLAGAPENR